MSNLKCIKCVANIQKVLNSNFKASCFGRFFNASFIAC